MMASVRAVAGTGGFALALAAASAPAGYRAERFTDPRRDDLERINGIDRFVFDSSVGIQCRLKLDHEPRFQKIGPRRAGDFNLGAGLGPDLVNRPVCTDLKQALVGANESSGSRNKPIGV